MSDTSVGVVTGIIQRGLLCLLQKLLPGVVADLGGIPGVVLKAALAMPFVQSLEAKLGDDAATWAGDKISALETECEGWMDSEFKKHPALLAFVDSVKPPAPVDLGGGFTVAEMAAIKAAKADGTLAAKLGIAS